MAIIFPNYTENIPQMLESHWKSDATFTYSILADVYKVANKNLHSIFPLNEDVKECKINEEDLLDLNYCGDNPDVDKILEDFSGPVTYIGIWACLAVIFTVVGIVWCICNKCCCCSQSKKINDLDYLVNTDSDSDLGIFNIKGSRANMIWKIVIAVLMTFWILGFGFGVFMSFASNEGLRRSIFELYDDMDLSMDDVELYINTTKRQIDATFITSYGNLSDKIREQLSAEKDILTFTSEKLSSKILLHSDDLLLKLKHLNQGNDDLNEPSKLNGLSDALLQLQTSLTQRVDPFLTRISQIGRDIATDVEEALRKTKETLDKNANDLTDALNKVEINETRQHLEDAENDWLDVAGSAIYGTFMGFNLILLIIFVSIVIGSVVVWVGKGPTKNIGFIFYRFSIVMMFLFGWIVAFAMLNGFVIAGFVTQNACVALRDMENETIVISPSDGFLSKLHLEDKVPIYKLPFAETMQDEEDTFYQVPTYSFIVNHCKQDDSAYNSFKLDQVYNISDIREISDNFRNITEEASRIKMGGIRFFIKNANSVYSTLYKDLVKLESYKNAVKATSAQNGAEALYSKVHFLTVALLQEIKTLESGEVMQDLSSVLNNTLHLVNDYEGFVETQLTTGIGKCRPLYHAVNATLHTFCYKVFAPVATYWWGLQFLLFMFVTVIGTALISERVFK